MRRTFIDDFGLLFEAELIDKRGRKKNYIVKTLTAEAAEQVPVLLARYDETNKFNEKVSMLCQVMALIFGGKEKNYKRYSVKLMFRVIKAFSEEVTGKAKDAGNPPVPGKVSGG